MTPDEYCQEKAAKSGSSFYYSFLFLPPERRRAITALYAFCREVDDVVDECTDPSVARIKLAWWRTQVDQLFAGKTDHPVMQALAPHLQTCDITASRLHAVIDGMEMDLDQTRYLDWPGLRTYCWHAAGVVGELSAGVFGYTDPQTLKYAEKLGLAFQMTNIIRDIGDDARRGRIYLPVNDMQQFEVKASDILNGAYSERFTALMRFETARTRELYKEAMALLPEQDRRAQRPGLMMAAIYHALLDEIERDQWQVLHQRISLTPVRKLWLAWKVWVGGGRSLVRRLSR
ncbi:MAG: squalene synthase HpnD [Comamonadaceae bacterium]|nr:MAG: squalene synthase HpnD [Comamonadaceae bacterium]